MLTTVHLALNINNGVPEYLSDLRQRPGGTIGRGVGGGSSGETMMFCSQGTLLVNSSVMAECSECRPESLGVSVSVHVFL